MNDPKSNKADKTAADICYISENEKFNFRVCAIILNAGKLLAMHDERSPYFYLPGGRVKLGETAEEAVLREVREELLIDASVVRPLWLAQSFFNEDVDKLNHHELCLYFLVDVSATDLLARANWPCRSRNSTRSRRATLSSMRTWVWDDSGA